MLGSMQVYHDDQGPASSIGFVSMSSSYPQGLGRLLLQSSVELFQLLNSPRIFFVVRYQVPTVNYNHENKFTLMSVLNHDLVRFVTGRGNICRRHIGGGGGRGGVRTKI